MVDADNTRKPERMPYAQNELNSNSNAPDEDPESSVKLVLTSNEFYYL